MYLNDLYGYSVLKRFQFLNKKSITLTLFGNYSDTDDSSKLCAVEATAVGTRLCICIRLRQ